MMTIPPPSDVTNVFAMSQPAHMLQKLFWEWQLLSRSLSPWTDNEGHPAHVFAAFNTAVTAWHITDWLWHSGAETRAILTKRFKLNFTEGTKNQLRVGLERFQDEVASESRPLYICRALANGSKHMRTNKVDPNIRAIEQWHPVVQPMALAQKGELVPSLLIADGNSTQDARSLFLDAFGYWEGLFVEENLLNNATRLWDKIRKVPALIDPPGPFAPVEEWIEYRNELARSNIPGVAPYIREADREIARLNDGK
jgi:hypothetical protein